ncbi:MAG: hypothetical protein ACHQX3_00715 [Nitrospirales bacterium]
MNEFSLSKSNLTIERDITPPMGAAITLTVLVDGKDVGLSIYVGRSSFRPGNSDYLIRQIADRLMLRPVNGQRKDI